MDPRLLGDPGFWISERPLAAGEFPGGLPDLPELTGKILFASSGSSGEPKWIAHHKESLLISAAAVNRHLAVNAESHWGLALPLRHVGGFGVLARAYEAACGWSAFPGKWDAHGFPGWVAAQGITHTSLVPAQVHDLVAAHVSAPACLRAIVVGGGRLAESAGRAARALGWPVLASYGMTESASQIATQPLPALTEPYHPEPIGILPVWRARTGAEGRLEIAGPALFAGMLVEIDGVWTYVPRTDEWHATGDRVIIGGNGLTPQGRLDAMVKILGELVDPEQVERELLETGCPMVAVAAVTDARAGHALVPVFERSADRTALAAAVRSYNRSSPGFRRLSDPVFIGEIPRSPLGKILRAHLAELIQRANCSPLP